VAACGVAEGPLEVIYPQDGTLFLPKSSRRRSVAGQRSRHRAWTITVRTEGEPDLAFTSQKAQWRPSEEDWKKIKQRSSERDAEVIIGPEGVGSVARLRIRTSKDPVSRLAVLP
jgi:hypothetical protein